MPLAMPSVLCLTHACACSGMLPGYVAGFYTVPECHIDLSKLARSAGARVVHAAACGVNTSQNQILFHDRPPMPYDCLSIDIGIAPQSTVPGAAEHTTPVKPVTAYASTRVSLCLTIADSCECLLLLAVRMLTAPTTSGHEISIVLELAD